jgi:tetratricopeptide (TPR) repeat protein
LLFIVVHCFSQVTDDNQKTIDSLKEVINTTESDTTKINAYMAWDDLIYISNPILDFDINQTIVSIAGANLKSDKLSASEKIGYKKRLATGLNNTGLYYLDQGDYANAIIAFTSALKLREELQDENGKSSALGNIGSIYYEQGDYDKAISYYNQCLAIQTKLGNKDGISTTYNNLSNIYAEQKKYELAIDYCFKAMKIAEEIEDELGVAYSLNNIGAIYNDQGNREKAIEYYTKSLEIKEKIGNMKGVAITLTNIGNIYLENRQHDKAELYAQKALLLSKEKGFLVEGMDAATSLYLNYKDQNKSKEALNMHELIVMYKDSINRESNHKEILRQEIQYNYEKQKAIDEKEHEKQLAISDEQKEKQKIVSVAIGIGLILALFLTFFIFNRLRLTRKQKQIIEHQKTIVEEKQKEILDSIVYAKRLQDAILPANKTFTSYLPNSFILYKPKDIVAGDFYWLEFKNDLVFVAVADCTGHGVPGALVSVVCSNALNRAVLEFNITDPGKILDKTKELVLETFAKSDKNVSDGMDISLCCINQKTNEIKWSGANNPLWYISNNTFKEIAPNKQPIGKTDSSELFVTHTLQLSKGDSIYLITDGFADQFGGPKGKKFKYKPLKELIIQNQTIEPLEIKNELELALDQWKGNLEQVDDVCIIGIKI